MLKPKIEATGIVHRGQNIVKLPTINEAPPTEEAAALAARCLNSSTRLATNTPLIRLSTIEKITFGVVRLPPVTHIRFLEPGRLAIIQYCTSKRSTATPNAVKR